ncbi:hypothetical protein Tco_0086363 [Tanacetum coccineum]
MQNQPKVQKLKNQSSVCSSTWHQVSSNPSGIVYSVRWRKQEFVVADWICTSQMKFLGNKDDEDLRKGQHSKLLKGLAFQIMAEFRDMTLENVTKLYSDENLI